MCGGGNPYAKWGKQCAYTCVSTDSGADGSNDEKP